MSSAETSVEMDVASNWERRNQEQVLSELDRIRQMLMQGTDAVREEPAASGDAPTAMTYIVDAFQLSDFERDLLWLCIGAELDAEIAQLCRQRSESTAGDAGVVTVDLALNVLPGATLNALTPVAPLRRWQMVDLKAGVQMLQARIRIDERVLNYVLGENYIDPYLEALVHPEATKRLTAPSHRVQAEDAATLLSLPANVGVTILLEGNDVHGRRDTAVAIAELHEKLLFRMSASQLVERGDQLDAFMRLWEREALLLDGLLLIEVGDDETEKNVANGFALRTLTPVILSAEALDDVEQVRRFEINRPLADEQLLLWQAALGETTADVTTALQNVASQFRFSAHQIEQISARVLSDPQPVQALMHQCAQQDRAALTKLGQLISSNVGWRDLVLADEVIGLLKQIRNRVKYRATVLEAWGFAGRDGRGLGTSVLFYGESGTGKTMAAEVIANELSLDLCRIDLSLVVSKFIGETEKNLASVFNAAEASGAILLFDEADALFGKRSDVKDAHDRYANLEVSYLLQRMESYSGLAILTTNHRTALDSAFTRRLSYAVAFPFPDAKQRERIWRNVFPPATPTGGLRYEQLAQLNVAGGSIRNIALNGCFVAAAEGRGVTMQDLAWAAGVEAAKREQTLSEAEIHGWT